MAIASLMVKWFAHLYGKGVLPNGGDLLELGPQDVFTPPYVIGSIAHQCMGPVEASRRLLALFPENGRELDQRQLYRLFGIENYSSIDLNDPRADWSFDLNQPVSLPRQFDLVTNFGTGEHVFNIGQLFRNIDGFLRDGGVALHVLPAFLDPEHGYYNIHPRLYFDLARSNQYKVEDFAYVDNFGVRSERLNESAGIGEDFADLPITAADIYQAGLARKVLGRFLANLEETETERITRSRGTVFFDYCFVALRKQPRGNNVPFAYPIEGGWLR